MAIRFLANFSKPEDATNMHRLLIGFLKCKDATLSCFMKDLFLEYKAELQNTLLFRIKEPFPSEML